MVNVEPIHTDGTDATEAEVKAAKRMYSLFEAQTTIEAWGRYDSTYTIVKVADSHYIARYVDNFGNTGVWGEGQAYTWGNHKLGTVAA